MKLPLNRKVVLTLLTADEQHAKRCEIIWSKYETDIATRIKSNGKADALEQYKACYLFLRNTILKLPTHPLPFCISDKAGIPKPLWSLRPFLKGNREQQRLALIIARSYESIYLDINYSTESITSARARNGMYEELKQEFNKFLEIFHRKHAWYFGDLQMLDSYNIKVFTTLSQGPNGPAVANAHLDAKAVMKDTTLYNNIKKFNQVVGQEWITKWMEIQASSFNCDRPYITGRLGFSSEPGGKTRIFAIADYWSQSSLKVLQISLYDTLKVISTDSTADQNKGFQTLLREASGKETYCFDLSSASDRIPAEMQSKRLDLMSGKPLGELWVKVMTDRNFFIKSQNRSVRWAVGQPLGLLSSFPSFALWHHDIIQFAYNRERIKAGKTPKFFKDYRLLGDDVVIYNKKVADTYQDLLQIIGIPINLNKSVIGSSENSQIEFTKRLALNGKEMSSIKHNILNKSSLTNTLDLIDILLERNFISQSTSHYGFRFLNRQENEKLSFLLWARSRCDAPFELKGDTTFVISRADYNQKIMKVRSNKLKRKAELLDKYLCGQKPIDTYYRKLSVPYSAKALGLEDYQHNNQEFHPLTWAVNQIGVELTDALSLLWDIPDEGTPLELCPVEYLPLISNECFFRRRKAKVETISQIILDALKEFKQEANALSLDPTSEA
jgi:hypothetical protein